MCLSVVVVAFSVVGSGFGTAIIIIIITIIIIIIEGSRSSSMDLRMLELEAHEKAEDERALAVAMALHPRLGEHSPLARLEWEILKGLCIIPQRRPWVYPIIRVHDKLEITEHNGIEFHLRQMPEDECVYDTSASSSSSSGSLPFCFRLLFRNQYLMYTGNVTEPERMGWPSVLYFGPPSAASRFNLQIIPVYAAFPNMSRSHGVKLVTICSRMGKSIAHHRWNPQRGPGNFYLWDEIRLEIWAVAKLEA